MTTGANRWPSDQRPAKRRQAARWHGWAAAGALWLFACAGRQLDGGTDTNTNWLGHCKDSDQPCTLLPAPDPEPDTPHRAPAPDPEAAPPSTSREVVQSFDRGNPFEFGTVDNCVVGCDALLPGPQCRGLDALPNLHQTLLDWQSPGCSFGALLEGNCEEGTRFLWKGGPASEVRYFTADGGFIGLSAFSSMPDASTCNGVRRWPQQIACNAPSVTRELCTEP